MRIDIVFPARVAVPEYSGPFAAADIEPVAEVATHLSVAVRALAVSVPSTLSTFGSLTDHTSLKAPLESTFTT